MLQHISKYWFNVPVSQNKYLHFYVRRNLLWLIKLKKSQNQLD